MAKSTQKKVFETHNGRVEMWISKMPGFCGAAVVHDVEFKPHKKTGMFNKRLFYKDFYNYLKTSGTPFNLNRCKILMTDYVNHKNQLVEGGPSIYDFCMNTPNWYVGPETLNGKTSRKVVVFELERAVDKSSLY